MGLETAYGVEFLAMAGPAGAVLVDSLFYGALYRVCREFNWQDDERRSR